MVSEFFSKLRSSLYTIPKVKLMSLLLGVTLGFILIAIMLGTVLKDDKLIIDSDSTYKVEILYKSFEGLYEVRVYNDGVYLYLNGERVKLLTTVQKKVNPLLILPETSEELNIRLTPADSDFTWISDLETSSKYLNFLENEGYRYVIEAHTSQFIEKFLYKDSEVLRVIIFRDKVMVGELAEGATLPTLQDYVSYNVEEG